MYNIQSEGLKRRFSSHITSQETYAKSVGTIKKTEIITNKEVKKKKKKMKKEKEKQIHTHTYVHTHTYGCGTKYTGEWHRHNYCHGHGTITFADGNTYTGYFKNNQQDGQGVYRWSNGDVYNGTWKSNEMNGHGTFQSKDGRKYIGAFKNNKFNGKGVLTFQNGKTYSGTFYNDQFHGNGTYTSSDGRQYIGEFKNGKKDGFGMFTWSNGNKYVGQFKDGKRHGSGTFTWADGRKYVGQWKSDKRINLIHYTIKAESVADGSISKELEEFQRASAQFYHHHSRNSKVTMVEVYENDELKQKYLEKKNEFIQKYGENTKEIWVFHGTAAVNVQSILSDGFKIGGQDIDVANGTKYGQGIYTATETKDPCYYNYGSNQLILSKALVGCTGRSQNGSDGADSWIPNRDWHVFRSGAQLLPCYVIHFNEHT